MGECDNKEWEGEGGGERERERPRQIHAEGGSTRDSVLEKDKD